MKAFNTLPLPDSNDARQTLHRGHQDGDTSTYRTDSRSRTLRSTFLVAIPKKLEGGVSVGLAYEVAEKYLDLESSNVVSHQRYYT